MQRTLLAILEEGSSKLLKRRPKYKHVFEAGDENRNYIVIATLDAQPFAVQVIEGIGKALKKRDAMHLAAGEVLQQVLETPYWTSFPFPEMEQSAATKFVQTQVAELKKLCNTTMPNPVHILHTLCSSKRLPDAAYAFDDTSDPNPKSFRVTCKVRQHTTIGEAVNKKGAKAIAAEQMISIIEALPAPSNEPKQGEFLTGKQFDPETPHTELDIDDVFDLIQYCEEALAKNDRVSALVNLCKTGALLDFCKTDFHVVDLPFPSNDMQVCARTLSFIDNDAADGEMTAQSILYSFHGLGVDGKSALDDAASNALTHLKYYYQQALRNM